MELAGLTKKRNNKLSLTKAGEKLLKEDDKLLGKVLEAYCNKFNWAYFDNYEGEQVGRFGFGFTFILLGKYGSQKRPDRFYAEKYFEAFPQLIDESFQPPFDDVRTYNYEAYSIRIFDRFLAFFGLAEIEQEKWDAEKLIRKTDLFDRLIKIRPHSSRPIAG